MAFPQDPSQAPSDPLADLKAAEQEIDTPAASAPTPSKSAPSNEPMSIGGFAENVMGQLHDIGKGILSSFVSIPKETPKIYKAMTDQFPVNDFGTHLLDSVSDTASHVASGIAGPESDYATTWNKYKDRPVAERLARIAYEKPITPILDGMTVLSLGGGMLGKAGKLAGGVSRAGMAADDVAKLGQMSTADRVATLGDHIAQIPERIGKGMMEAPLRAVGINPDSLKTMRTYEGEAKAFSNQMKADEAAKFNEVFKGFSDADKQALDKMAMEGANPAELQANPKAAAALDNWKRFLSEREGTLGEQGRNLLTQDTMNDVIAKKYANRVYGGVTDANVEAAKRDIAAMHPDMRPVYTPAIGEKAEHSILDLLRGKEEVIPPGSGTGFLKPYKGTGERISDPTVYMRKGVQQFADMEGRLQFLDNVIRDKNLTKLAGPGEKTLADLMPEGFYRKYAADELRAQGKGLQELKAGMPTAVEKTNALEMVTKDPMLGKYIEGLKGVAAQNNTVGNYLKWAFARQPEGLARFVQIYDKVMGIFKSINTLGSPKWYVAKTVGEAVLSTMAGEYGLNWKLAKKALGSMPPALREGGKYIAMEVGDFNKRYLHKLSDLSGAAEELVRRGVWTKEVAGKFKQAASSFAAGAQSLEEFTKAVGEAARDLPNLQSGIQQLDENIARSSKRIQQLEKDFQGLQKDLVAEQQAVAAGKGTPGKLQEINADIIKNSQTRQAMIADRRTRMVESGAVEQRIPELTKYAEISRDAIRRQNMFLGDFLYQGPIERSVFSRAVPFYGWTKAMARLTFMLPFIAPKTAFFWHRWAAALSTMAGDKNLPDYMATYAPIGSTMKDGKPALVWIDATTISHFGKFFQTRIGEMPIPKLLAFWKENPILLTGYRLIGGRDEFYWAGRPNNGQVWVSAGDGQVRRFRQDGKIETVIPQAPVVRTVASMFYPSQIMDEMEHHLQGQNYDIAKGPAQNPDGSYRFPKETWQTLLEMIGPRTKIGSAQDIVTGEQRQVQRTLMDLQRAYKTAGPEEREYIRGVFEDYQKGMFRHMKTGA